MSRKREYDVIYVVHSENKRRGSCLFDGLYLFLSIATLGALPLSVWLFKSVGRSMATVLRVLAQRIKFVRRAGGTWWSMLSEHHVTLDGRFLFFGGVAPMLVWVINQASVESSASQGPHSVFWAAIGRVFPFLLLVVIGELGYWAYTEHKKLEEVKQENELLRSDAERYFAQEWLASPPKHFRNEIEVEVKFVYPLLKFLGFEDDDLSVREWVQVRVGRQVVKGEADWVVRKEGRPFLIVEAKELSVMLKEEVREQAQSYAFALKAPYYMITNGRTLRLYRRGVEDDEMIVDCEVDELVACWPQLAAHLK